MGRRHITSSQAGQLDIYFTASEVNKYFNTFLDTVLHENKYFHFWALQFNMCNLLFATAITFLSNNSKLSFNQFILRQLHTLAAFQKRRKKVSSLCGLMGSCASDNLKITLSLLTRIWVKAAWRKKNRRIIHIIKKMSSIIFRSGITLCLPAKYCDGAERIGWTGLLCGWDSSRPWRLCSGLWHQDVSSRSWKSCKLPGENQR